MNYIQIIGIVAAVLTTLSFLPQAIKAIKTKDTRGISLTMYSLFFLGVTLWLIYGILINDLPIILANGLTFILAGTILILKLKYK
ncbi:MAG: MtN3 and saliva related transmembrane protein [Saprospiraceae bacterium]|jgi:MtN3 and saliva related transmembrane protein